MASLRIRRTLAASAAFTVTVLGTVFGPAPVQAAASAPAPAAIPTATRIVPVEVSHATTAQPARRRGTPNVAPRRTVLRDGQPIVFAGRADAGSTVRVSAVLDKGWAFLTPPTAVRQPGVVRISAMLPREGVYLVRADVVSPDRSTRYGFGPYVVTVAARGTRLPTYVTYSLAELLRFPEVTASATSGPPITVGGDRFAYDAAGRGPAYPDWSPAVTAAGLGCISANLQFAVADGDAGSALVRISNRYAGRGALSSTRAGTVGTVVSQLDGGRFTIDVSGGATAHLRGTFTCPKDLRDR